MLLFLVVFLKGDELCYEEKIAFLENPWWGTAPSVSTDAPPLLFLPDLSDSINVVLAIC